MGVSRTLTACLCAPYSVSYSTFSKRQTEARKDDSCRDPATPNPVDLRGDGRRAVSIKADIVETRFMVMAPGGERPRDGRDASLSASGSRSGTDGMDAFRYQGGIYNPDAENLRTEITKRSCVTEKVSRSASPGLGNLQWLCCKNRPESVNCLRWLERGVGA